MRYYLVLWTILIALVSASWGTADTIQPLAPLDPLPAGTVVSEYVERIRCQYQSLARCSWTEKSFANSIREINNLRTSLFQTQIPYEPLPDEKNLILTLRFIKFNIKSMIESSPFKVLMIDLFKSTFERLDQRCSLSRILFALQENKGVMGKNVLNNIPVQNVLSQQRFRRAISAFVGRIFVIGNDKVISTSSGIIVPCNDGSVIHYDRIVTCGHSVSSLNTNPNLEFYFVRCEGIEPETGIPDSGAIQKFNSQTSTDEDDQIRESPKTSIRIKNFIKYLRLQNKSGNLVRRIVKFITPDDSHPDHTSILTRHAPRYEPHEDRGWGVLEKDFNFNNTQYLAQVRIAHTLPEFDYYHAIGYPSFPYFKVDEICWCRKCAFLL